MARGAHRAAAAAATVLGVVLALLAGPGAAGCTEAGALGGALYPALTVGDVGPALVLPGSRLVVACEGLVAGGVVHYQVRLAGSVAGSAVDARYEAVVVEAAGEAGAGVLDVALDGALFARVPAEEATFEGTLTVLRATDSGEGDATVTRPLTLALVRHAVPEVVAWDVAEVFPGDRVAVQVAGALLPGEGETALQLDGTFITEAPVELRPIAGLVFPVDPYETAPDRGRVTFALTPDLFGIRPGRFEGAVRVINAHPDGVTVTSEALAIGPVALRPPVVTATSPEGASRGQKLTFRGRGFLASDGLLQSATVFLAEGEFAPTRGLSVVYEGAEALVVYPEVVVGNTSAEAVLRVTVGGDGRFAGLGSETGTFSGRLTPLVLFGSDQVAGPSFPFVLAVRHPKQVVQIRILPGFAEALAAFGLTAERVAVEARILEVCRRDYVGINIAFDYQVPTDFAEYAIVEVGGHDPNGTGLFGLDNTAGKDVGNLRFDDVIGGFNADTRAGNFAAYGGVFAAEFMQLSARLSTHILASPRFDDIFGGLAPSLGGTPAKAGESQVFDDRGAAIKKAVRVLGNIVGSTVTHEVGHSLGLTALEGKYHNPGDTPNWLMDEGKARPFEERAEIDGFGPAVFEPHNRTYLESILPLDTDATREETTP